MERGTTFERVLHYPFNPLAHLSGIGYRLLWISSIFRSSKTPTGHVRLIFSYSPSFCGRRRTPENAGWLR
jgi:hypothetical protein